MNRIINFNAGERYLGINVFIDENNHDNDYAQINYAIYYPNGTVNYCQKSVPSWMINMAINEFEFQNRGKLANGEQINFIYRKQEKKHKKSKKDIIKILSITAITIGVLAGGYSLVKNNGNQKQVSYNIEQEKTIFGDIDDVSYRSGYHPQKDAIIAIYDQYLDVVSNINSGNCSEEDIDRFISLTNILINNNLFINIPAFNQYYLTDYSLNVEKSGIENIQIVNNNEYFKYVNKNIKRDTERYLKEQCRHLFCERDEKTGLINYPNSMSGVGTDDRGIYFVADNIEENDSDNSYILMQISGLMQLKKYIIENNYTYIDENERGVHVVFAYQNQLIEMIDAKIEKLTTILKNRCLSNSNNLK